MPIIAKIEQQKKNTNRFNIYFLNNEIAEFAFGVSDDTLVRFSLSKGKEISEEEIKDIQFDDLVSKAFQAAINYVSYRPRSEKEMQAYLKEQECDAPVITEVISRLKKYHYIDDLKFAQAYVRNEMNISKKGPYEIQRALLEKGISAPLQEKALQEYPEELQEENALKWAKKSLQKQKTSQREAYQKTLQFIMNKGFTMDQAREAVAQVGEIRTISEWDSLCTVGYKYHRKYSRYEVREYTQKMKQALFIKGYPIELIHQFLSQGKEAIENGEIEEGL